MRTEWELWELWESWVRVGSLREKSCVLKKVCEIGRGLNVPEKKETSQAQRKVWKYAGFAFLRAVLACVSGQPRDGNLKHMRHFPKNWLHDTASTCLGNKCFRKAKLILKPWWFYQSCSFLRFAWPNCGIPKQQDIVQRRLPKSLYVRRSQPFAPNRGIVFLIY